jgi:hypothetical protein
MDYLTTWYEAERQGKSDQTTYSPKELLDIVSPYKKGLRLSVKKLGNDLKKAPFEVIKDRTRKGVCYTVVWR